MAAKSLLFRPNVAALCLAGSRSFLRRTPSMMKMMSTSAASFNLSSGRLLFSWKLLPSSVSPIRRNFCIRATADSDSSTSIGSPLMETMEKKIQEHLSADSVVVKDAYGDGRHVSIEVIASAFEGQSAVNRQRMVYKAIWEELQDKVHAVDQMTTWTPSEAAAGKS
ncbi:BolA-like family protein [Perilla frutescens var. hirtella]|uniref:BolA-like family protein n=1 Tax=Perilla frutescens var. hirtella TaxID=608512 RepID=A0AAD4JLQ8_PERFH|nr:BolA-like family protein [Perilla frutescens var. hirtella]